MYIIVFYRYSQANYRGLVVELHLVPYAGFLTTNVVGLLYSSHPMGTWVWALGRKGDEIIYRFARCAFLDPCGSLKKNEW